MDNPLTTAVVWRTQHSSYKLSCCRVHPFFHGSHLPSSPSHFLDSWPRRLSVAPGWFQPLLTKAFIFRPFIPIRHGDSKIRKETLRTMTYLCALSLPERQLGRPSLLSDQHVCAESSRSLSQSEGDGKKGNTSRGARAYLALNYLNKPKRSLCSLEKSSF